MNQVKCSLKQRQQRLIELNIDLLQQGGRVLDRLTDAQYNGPIGRQMRHILEFYQCFLEGVETCHIDYDSRRRNKAVETERPAARKAIRSTILELEANPSLLRDSAIFIRIEGAPDFTGGDAWILSSIGREMQALTSHTTHHYAVMETMLRGIGVEIEPGFGYARSTLAYMARKSTEAA